MGLRAELGIDRQRNRLFADKGTETMGGGPSPGPPDAPTVHADPERTFEMLEWLQEGRRAHQVMVVSQESQVAEWATERLDPDVDAFVGLVDAGSASAGHSDLTQRWI